MKNKISIFFYTLLISVFITSCSSEQSLQKYYVEKQNNDNFIAVDLPASLINMNENISEESKETLKSLKKLNILAFKINDTNSADFVNEYETIKNILSNKDFNDLMRAKHENISFTIKYLGDEESIDEVVLLASEKTKGFLIARVLGDDMKLGEIMKLLNEVDNFDSNNDAFAQIGDLLKEIN